MKVHLIQVAVIVLAIVAPLLATPVAASPKDPDSFLVMPIGQGDCNTTASFGDPLSGLCPSGVPELATNQLVSSGQAEAQRLLRNAVNAVTSAGSRQYTLDMRMTTTDDGIPPTGKTITGEAISIYRVINGQITDARGIWDRSEVWQQLGLIPDTETILGARGVK